MSIPHAVSTATVYMSTNSMVAFEVHETPIVYDDLTIDCSSLTSSPTRLLCNRFANRMARSEKKNIERKLSEKMKAAVQKHFDAKMPYPLPKNSYGRLYRYYIGTIGGVAALMLILTFICFPWLLCRWCGSRKYSHQTLDDAELSPAE